MNLTGLMSKPEKDTSKKTFIRTCKLCGRDFIAPTNNTMRCPECRKVMRQQQSAASYKRFLTKMEMRKMREKSPRFNFFIGRTYVLVFHIDNSRQLNERTLAAVYTG